jgi:biopolymer transport protein ExbB
MTRALALMPLFGMLALQPALRAQEPATSPAPPAAAVAAGREVEDAQAAGQTDPSPPPDGTIAEGHGLIAMFNSGGFLMWPILLCSVVTLTFILERAMGLRARHIFPPRLASELRALAREGRAGEALARCLADRSPFAALMHACLLRAGNAGFEMEAALEEAGARLLYDLRRNCKPLSVMADVAPLLGLMGTVTGMIKAFDVVARSGALGRTELLAEGIAEALLTTAFGLLVAVPAIVAYHIYRAKAENLLREMEDTALEILTALRGAGGDAGATAP